MVAWVSWLDKRLRRALGVIAATVQPSNLSLSIMAVMLRTTYRLARSGSPAATTDRAGSFAFSESRSQRARSNKSITFRHEGAGDGHFRRRPSWPGPN